jgi:hypothetical protein
MIGTDTPVRETNNRQSHGPPPQAAPPTASQSPLAGRWWIALIVVIAAVVIAGATYLISKRVPATYSSSSTIAIQLSGTNANDTTQAANNLASQYAQVVSAQPVLGAAKRSLDPSAANGLSSAISGGTVGDQNIVSVRATGRTPEQAQERAAAVTTAFIRYVRNLALRQSHTFNTESQAGLKPVDRQIRRITAQLSKFGSPERPSARYLTLQQTLSTLLTQRSSTLANIAQTSVGGLPSVTVVNPAGPGGQTAPRPTLYAAVAFVLALLIVGRLVVWLTPRRQIA